MVNNIGINWGEVGLSTDFAYFMDGLTGNRYAWVRPHPSNAGNIFLKTKAVGVGNGFLVAPSDPPIKVDTRWDNQMYLAKGSTNGCTIYWLGCGTEGE